MIPLVRAASGHLKVKETVAITMLDRFHVIGKSFEDSHLCTKLKRIIAVTRLYENQHESESFVLGHNEFRLEGTDLYDEVARDYRKIQAATKADEISSTIGRYIQARTKGRGHGSTTRAFYAKKPLVEYIIGWKRPTVVSPETHPNIDCPIHAGSRNSKVREDLDGVMSRLYRNQSGVGRHKCPYCAYQAGFRAGVASVSDYDTAR